MSTYPLIREVLLLANRLEPTDKPLLFRSPIDGEDYTIIQFVDFDRDARENIPNSCFVCAIDPRKFSPITSWIAIPNRSYCQKCPNLHHSSI
jgi:hypothetical protein